MKNMQQNLSYFLLLVAVFAIGSFGTYFVCEQCFSEPSPSANASSETSPDETATTESEIASIDELILEEPIDLELELPELKRSVLRSECGIPAK